MESLWRKQTGEIELNKGKGGQKTREDETWDVIVIGAGMAGLLIAYYLKEQGKKVLVLEADRMASGQTEKTTAKITSQHGLCYHQFIKDVGVKKARLYAKANEMAIKEYEKLIKEKEINCHFERGPAYLYSIEQEAVPLLRAEAKAAIKLGIDAFFTTDTELPFAVTGAVCFRHQAQFAPLEFVKGLAEELKILEHEHVLKIRGNQVFTKNKTWHAEKIVVATHYPLLNVPGFYFLRQHQERSYVLALSDCEKIRGMYLGIDKEGLSFRQEGEYLLLGGCSHRTGLTECAGAYKKLRIVARKYYPKAEEVAHWSAQDCMPHDKIPFIGKYSIFTPNLYVATGFQKWGMTSSMIAAQIIRDEICGMKNPYKKLFSPQRLNVRAGLKDFLTDVGESTKGIFRGTFFNKNPRCTHMGCELKWNPNEQSWDCPCHGSRFTKEGKLLDNPAKKPLN